MTKTAQSIQELASEPTITTVMEEQPVSDIVVYDDEPTIEQVEQVHDHIQPENMVIEVMNKKMKSQQS
jgi:hypothetical protein